MTEEWKRQGRAAWNAMGLVENASQYANGTTAEQLAMLDAVTLDALNAELREEPYTPTARSAALRERYRAANATGHFCYWGPFEAATVALFTAMSYAAANREVTK